MSYKPFDGPTVKARVGGFTERTMSCHDAGKKEIHLTMSVPRDRFAAIPGLNHKVMAEVDCPHFVDLAKVSHPDFLATNTGRVTGITFDHVEGLPTGATMGVISGHSTDSGFKPIPTDDTTAHVDCKGDTHVFHAVVSGRAPKGSGRKVNFSVPETHANKDQIIAKVERWSDVTPEDVEMKVFSAQNSGGQKKTLAAIPTASALGRLIAKNQDNPKFRQSTGEIRKIVDNDAEHFVTDASSAAKLGEGLKAALDDQSIWPKAPLSFRLITDADTLKGTGNHPLNLSATVHRDDAETVANTGTDGTTATAIVPVETAAGDFDSGADSLARKVFEHESDVVSIKSEGRAAGGEEK